MSRFHYWQFLINSEGQPIPDANISVYLAGTNAPANIYFDEYGSNHTAVAPQVITNNMGYFEFWVGDSSEEFGYLKGQKFKLEWEKPGVALGEIDWIDVFPHVIEVDETDLSNAKNKVISNKLAFRWEEHRKHVIQDNGFPIHGIEPINELDSNNFPNKLISNLFGKRWNDHSISSFSSLPLSAVTTPHGLEPADHEDPTDNTFNKLVSNKLMYDIINVIGGNAGNIYLPHVLSTTWTLTHNFGSKYVAVTAYGTDDKEIVPKEINLVDYNTVQVVFYEPTQGYAVITGNVIEGGPTVPPMTIEGDHGSLTGLLSDDHTLYILADGTRAFSGPVSGISPTIASHLTTKEYVDDEIENAVYPHSRISNAGVGDDHFQYAHIDARRGFTNPIIGRYPIYPDHLATKSYVDEITTSLSGDIEEKVKSDFDNGIHSNITVDTSIDNRISLSVPLATTTIYGVTRYGSSTGTACEGDDPRLSDARVPLSHEHSASDTTTGTFDAARIPGLDASKIITGTLSLSVLPAAALERLVIVADETARFLLTTASVQNGDTVKQLDTNVMYRVVDDTKLDEEDGYVEYVAMRAAAVDWSGIENKPVSFDPVSHVHETLSIGTGLSGSDYDGGTAQTWSVAYGTIAGTACQGNDARLSDARTPAVHSLTGSLHSATTLAELNAKITDATLIDTNDARLASDRTRKITVSTSTPSGGTDGDIWMVY